MNGSTADQPVNWFLVIRVLVLNLSLLLSYFANISLSNVVVVVVVVGVRCGESFLVNCVGKGVGRRRRR